MIRTCRAAAAVAPSARRCRLPRAIDLHAEAAGRTRVKGEEKLEDEREREGDWRATRERF